MKSNQNQSIPDLTPCSDNPILQKLHQERAEHEKEVKRLNNELRVARNELFSTRQRLKMELVKAHQEEFDSFYNQLMNLKSVELMLWEEYHLQKYNLLHQLRNQQIDNSTYRRTLRQYSIKANNSSNIVREFYSEGVERIFGMDKNLFSIDVLQTLVKASTTL
ncbi:MAG: hypothetical protein HDS97_07250 [Bacteroidales bacterium]|nr:hypothetical protein [Bacteroidales bacterium]